MNKSLFIKIRKNHSYNIFNPWTNQHPIFLLEYFIVLRMRFSRRLTCPYTEINVIILCSKTEHKWGLDSSSRCVTSATTHRRQTAKSHTTFMVFTKLLILMRWSSFANRQGLSRWRGVGPVLSQLFLSVATIFFCLFLSNSEYHVIVSPWACCWTVSVPVEKVTMTLTLYKESRLFK